MREKKYEPGNAIGIHTEKRTLRLMWKLTVSKKLEGKMGAVLLAALGGLHDHQTKKETACGKEKATSHYPWVKIEQGIHLLD